MALPSSAGQATGPAGGALSALRSETSLATVIGSVTDRLAIRRKARVIPRAGSARPLYRHRRTEAGVGGTRAVDAPGRPLVTACRWKGGHDADPVAAVTSGAAGAPAELGG